VGLVCGAVYMVFIILTQLVYARDNPALVSSCRGLAVMVWLYASPARSTP